MISRRLFTLSPLAVLLAEQASATEPDLAFPLDMTGPRPRVQLSIPGADTEMWVFDTGAGESIVDIERARRWRMAEEAPIQVGSPAGGEPVRGFLTTVSGASISASPVPTFRVAAIQMMIANGDHAGVLSPNIFRGRLVAFDFAHGEVRVTDRTHAPADAGRPYTVEHPLPAIEVRVGEQSFEAHIDSGAPHVISFPYAIAPSLPLMAPPELAGTARFVDGERPRYRAQLQGELHIGPLTLNNPTIGFVDGLPFVNVGVTALRRMIVTLDPERRVSWAALSD